MTTFKDIYPQDILDLIDNKDFNNTELKNPMIKSQQIADILGITYNEDLYPWAEFDTDARQIVPHTQNGFITNRRKDMRSIAYILLKTPTNYKNIHGDNWQDKLLHVKITMKRAYKGGVDCYINKNDRHLDNNDIIKCFKECFGF